MRTPLTLRSSYQALNEQSLVSTKTPCVRPTFMSKGFNECGSRVFVRVCKLSCDINR